jgi:hypothetical protein
MAMALREKNPGQKCWRVVQNMPIGVFWRSGHSRGYVIMFRIHVGRGKLERTRGIEHETTAAGR